MSKFVDDTVGSENDFRFEAAATWVGPHRNGLVQSAVVGQERPVDLQCQLRPLAAKSDPAKTRPYPNKRQILAIDFQMINPTDDPVGWAMLMYELDDAHEHLGNLIKAISSDPEYTEEEFRVNLGHVLAHLNRSWRRRLVHGDMTDEEWDVAREYPADLRPIA